ncbi:MAG: hypothetical protein AB7N76_15700 [Planctomycetota bacterium]
MGGVLLGVLAISTPFAVLVLLGLDWTRARWAAAWGDVARDHGLAFEPAGQWEAPACAALSGVLGGRQLSVGMSAEDGVARVSVPVAVSGLEVVLEAEGLSSLAERLVGARELHLGHAEFDRRFWIHTDDGPRASYLLGPEVREGLLAAGCDEARLRDGELVLSYEKRWLRGHEHLTRRVSRGLRVLRDLPARLEARDRRGAGAAARCGPRPPVRTRRPLLAQLVPVAGWVLLIGALLGGRALLEARGATAQQERAIRFHASLELELLAMRWDLHRLVQKMGREAEERLAAPAARFLSDFERRRAERAQEDARDWEARVASAREAVARRRAAEGKTEAELEAELRAELAPKVRDADGLDAALRAVFHPDLAAAGGR